MRYDAHLTAGALKLPESRVIANLLLQDPTPERWKQAIEEENVLQARSCKTAQRLTLLLRGRLQTTGPELWRLVRDGSKIVAAHACLAAAVKHSPLLGDFLDLVVREQYRLFQPNLNALLWERYAEDCLDRDPGLQRWSDSTIDRLRSSVFQILAQAGYVESTRNLKLQTVHIARQVLRYLGDRDEQYVLRCIEVAP